MIILAIGGQNGAVRLLFSILICRRSSKDVAPSSVCKFFLNGSCMYGSKCRFDHIRPKPQTATSSRQSQHVTTFEPPQPSSQASRMTVLSPKKPASQLRPIESSWVHAPEFVPSFSTPTHRPMSQSVTFASLFAKSQEEEQAHSLGEEVLMSAVLCPYAEATGECTIENCLYLHGDKCPCCQKCCLHPDDPIGNEEHLNQCVASVERGIKHAEVEQFSETIDCSICLEKVLGKSDLSERRFDWGCRVFGARAFSVGSFM
jgi:E3 ubiquitin-protein ligase makorin